MVDAGTGDLREIDPASGHFVVMLGSPKQRGEQRADNLNRSAVTDGATRLRWQEALACELIGQGIGRFA